MFLSLVHLCFGYCFVLIPAESFARASHFEFLTEKMGFSVKH